MDREQIQKYLPHRGQMLLLDSCECIEGVSFGKYTVRGDEFFLDGHFPGFKVVPAVILCEIMAQSSFPIFIDELKDCLPMYAGIKNAKFKKQVKPGDTVTAKCQSLKTLRPFYTVKSTLSVGGEVCASGELMFCLVRQNSGLK